MKNLTLTGMALLCLFLSLNPLHSQITTGALLGREALEGMREKAKKKKAGKLAEKHTVLDTMGNGQFVPIMRVPADQVKGEAKTLILQVQARLETARLNHRNNHHVNGLEAIDQDIRYIGYKDLDWVTEYYKAELDFYSAYEHRLTAQESEARRESARKQRMHEDSLRRAQKTDEIRLQAQLRHSRDSVAAVERAKWKAEQRRADSLATVKQMRNDSLARAERMSGYRFVNVDELSLREQPSSKSKKLGMIGVGSYVMVLDDKPVNGYVKVSVSDYEGFVFADYLVDDLSKITVEGANLSAPKQYYYTSFETKPATNPKLHRGPKGGCYYIGPSGKKVYVDRSLCD